MNLKKSVIGTVVTWCLLLTPVLMGCEETEDFPADEPIESETMNALNEAEREEGWELLFDGENLASWRGYRQSGVPEAWEAADGTIHFTGEGDGGDIITQQEYDDFELSLEWKISECGNSGIFYRVQESDQYEQTYFTGPEYQVLDNTCHPDAQNGLDRTAAANYALQAPSQDVTRPAGEWNQTRIVVDGAHVEHWLNGEKVVEYELWSDAWKEQVQNSKFTQWPDYGLAEEGHIALQDHGDEVWFRNVKVRPL